MKQNNYRPIQQVNDTLPIRATCFHPTGEVYVVGTNSKALKICRYPNLEQRQRITSLIDDDENLTSLDEPEYAFTCLHIHCGSVYCASFNHAGDLLATGSNDQVVHMIKYNQTKHAPEGPEYKLSMHSGTVRDLCFMTGSNSSLLVSGGAGEFEINITDCNTLKPVHILRGHESTVMSLDSCHDSSHTFVSGSLDGTIRLWDKRNKFAVAALSCNALRPPDGDSFAQQPNNKPTNNEQDENRDQLQVGGHDESLQENCLSVARNNSNHSNHGKEATRAATSECPPGIGVGVVRVEPSGRLLASGHQDGTCCLFDLRGRQLIQRYQAHGGEIRALNFSPKSYYLLTGGYDHKIKLTDLQGHLEKWLPSVEVAELEDKVVQVAWHTSDYNFVSTCADGSATLWAIPDLSEWIDSIVMD